MFICSFLILFGFSAFRYDVGMDYLSYQYWFDWSSGGLNPDIREQGFSFFFYLLNSLGLGYDSAIFILAFITILLVFKYIKKYSPYLVFSVLIFYCFGQLYFTTFNAIRQAVAIYAFYAIAHYIMQRKFVKYLFTVLLLTTFSHLTAILLLPLYFFLHKEYTALIKIILLIVVLCSMFLVVKLIELSPYAFYTEFDQYINEISPTMILLLTISFILFIVDIRWKGKKKNEVLLFNINMLLIATLLLSYMVSGTALLILISRMSYYFIPVIIVLIPIVISRLRIVSNRKIVVVGLSLFLSVMCIYSLMVNGKANNLIPYTTIFSN